MTTQELDTRPPSWHTGAREGRGAVGMNVEQPAARTGGPQGGQAEARRSPTSPGGRSTPRVSGKLLPSPPGRRGAAAPPHLHPRPAGHRQWPGAGAWPLSAGGYRHPRAGCRPPWSHREEPGAGPLVAVAAVVGVVVLLVAAVTLLGTPTDDEASGPSAPRSSTTPTRTRRRRPPTRLTPRVVWPAPSPRPRSTRRWP